MIKWESMELKCLIKYQTGVNNNDDRARKLKLACTQGHKVVYFVFEFLCKLYIYIYIYIYIYRYIYCPCWCNDVIHHI